MSYFGNKDTDLIHAIEIIKADYGVDVSLESKNKDLLKFGSSDQVQTTPTTLMQLPTGTYNETYVNRNLITSFSTNNAANTGKITIEGHTVGSDISVSSITQTGGTATVTTGSSHGYSTNDWVYIEGANEAGYNGIVKITVTGTTTFTYTVDAGTASPATGTITSTNQNKTFVTQTIQMNGTTTVALSTNLARATRLYIPSQNKATDFTGTGYVFETDTTTGGVPDTDSLVHIMISNVTSTPNQSLKASTSISSTDFWIVTSFHGHVLTKQASWIDVVMEVREIGGVFREVENVSVSSSAATESVHFKPYKIIPANADIRLRATADTNGRSGAGSIQGYLVKVI